eukprot:m.35099 g.35099  ORF g.35099 m.35099 type:complete len:272 (+) comp8833_c0_seq1:289-1104(+)
MNIYKMTPLQMVLFCVGMCVSVQARALRRSEATSTMNPVATIDGLDDEIGLTTTEAPDIHEPTLKSSTPSVSTTGNDKTTALPEVPTSESTTTTDEPSMAPSSNSMQIVTIATHSMVQLTTTEDSNKNNAENTIIQRIATEEPRKGGLGTTDNTVDLMKDPKDGKSSGNNSAHKSSSSAAVISGTVVGIVLLLTLLVVLAAVVRSRNKKVDPEIPTAVPSNTESGDETSEAEGQIRTENLLMENPIYEENVEPEPRKSLVLGMTTETQTSM